MGAEKKKTSKQKKMAVRVDFTPMVDMNMLLITFFMLCTSLSKPQTMEINMPTNDKNIKDEDRSAVKESEAVTLLLGENDKIYYYEGKPDFKNFNSLKLTTYKPDGIRKVLQEKNIKAMREVELLNQQKQNLKINQKQYEEKLAQISQEAGTPTVIIKAQDKSSYKNLIDALDEMHICNIGKYVITPITSSDQFLIKNFESKGAHANQFQQ